MRRMASHWLREIVTTFRRPGRLTGRFCERLPTSTGQRTKTTVADDRHQVDDDNDVRHCAMSSPTLPGYLVGILDLLPTEARNSLVSHKDITQLIEVVMDFGRFPVARFPSGDVLLSSRTVYRKDLQDIEKKVGDFGQDNRAGISGTLHRISCIRNRLGNIIGVTCRVGRDIPNGAHFVEDIIRQGKSILIVGPPGSGKTTAIRSMCKQLADIERKRVVIVDTSNEIAGDGDVPHASVGSSRRMQVPETRAQHHVMIEAVQNHTPEVIVIDEIGTRQESEAARTISRRGIKLIATAHGNTLNDILRDPALQDLLGGLHSTVLGDVMARARGGSKTKLERKWPPSFDVLVEMVDRKRCRVYDDLAKTIDIALLGIAPSFQERYISQDGAVKAEMARGDEAWKRYDEQPDISRHAAPSSSKKGNKTKVIYVNRPLPEHCGQETKESEEKNVKKPPNKISLAEFLVKNPSQPKQTTKSNPIPVEKKKSDEGVKLTNKDKKAEEKIVQVTLEKLKEAGKPQPSSQYIKSILDTNCPYTILKVGKDVTRAKLSDALTARTNQLEQLKGSFGVKKARKKVNEAYNTILAKCTH